MTETTMLCVSVLAGEDLLSGPDWVKVENSKTLIDVLVQISGTNALGQQVQVIVSKEPSFTEAALVQVLSPISLLSDSRSIYIKFLLRSSVLSFKGQWGCSPRPCFPLKQSVNLKCKAERDTDTPPLHYLQRDNLVQKFIKDSELESPSKLYMPFESDYLNKIFIEQKLYQASLNGNKKDIGEQTSCEAHKLTTWQQQCEKTSQIEFDTKSQSLSGHNSLISLSLDGLTKWTQSKSPFQNCCTDLDGHLKDNLVMNSLRDGHAIVSSAVCSIDGSNGGKTADIDRHSSIDPIKNSATALTTQSVIDSDGHSLLDSADTCVSSSVGKNKLDSASKGADESKARLVLQLQHSDNESQENLPAEASYNEESKISINVSSNQESRKEKLPKKDTGKAQQCSTNKKNTQQPRISSKHIQDTKAMVNTKSLLTTGSAAEKKEHKLGTPSIRIKPVQRKGSQANAPRASKIKKKSTVTEKKTERANTTAKSPSTFNNSTSATKAGSAKDTKTSTVGANEKFTRPVRVGTRKSGSTCFLTQAKTTASPCFSISRSSKIINKFNDESKQTNAKNTINTAEIKHTVSGVKKGATSFKVSEEKDNIQKNYCTSSSEVTIKEKSRDDNKLNHFEIDMETEDKVVVDIKSDDNIEDLNNDLRNHECRPEITTRESVTSASISMDASMDNFTNSKDDVDNKSTQKLPGIHADGFRQVELKLDCVPSNEYGAKISEPRNKDNSGLDVNHEKPARNKTTMPAFEEMASISLEANDSEVRNQIKKELSPLQNMANFGTQNDNPILDPDILHASFKKESIVKRSPGSRVALFVEESGNITGTFSDRDNLEKDQLTGDQDYKYSYRSTDDSLDKSPKSSRFYPNNVNGCMMVKRTGSLNENHLSSINKKSGFFDNLKERTIDSAHCSFEKEETANDNLLDLENSSFDDDLAHECSLLNATIDKDELGNDSLVLDYDKTFKSNSVVFLGEISRDAKPNRTFTFDEKDQEAAIASSELSRDIIIDDVIGYFLKLTSLDADKHGKPTDAVDDCKDSSSEPPEPDFCYNMNENVACHIMDQLLLSSLLDISDQLNQIAARVANKTRIRRNSLSGEEEESKRFNAERVPAKSEPAEVFNNLRQLEKHVLEIEENLQYIQ
eukprot:gene20648-22685_t